MRFFTILAATCAIVISANASSIKKRQSNSPQNSCKEALVKGLTNSNEAKKTLRGLDLEALNSAGPIFHHVNILNEDIQSTYKYCCKISVVEEIRADIEKSFNTYHQILYDIGAENPNFSVNPDTEKLVEKLTADCKSKFKGDPSQDLQFSSIRPSTYNFD